MIILNRCQFQFLDCVSKGIKDIGCFSLGKEGQAAKAKATHRLTLSILMDFLVMTFCISDGFVDRLSVVRRHTCCVVAVSNLVVSNIKSKLAFVYGGFITFQLRKCCV